MTKKIAPHEKVTEQHEAIPLAEEQAEVSTQRVVDRRIRISRSTTTAEKLLETELWHEEVKIEHIEKNEPVEAGYFPEVRQEGDVLIVPVIEEQVEIIRHYILKEEVHIHKLKKSEQFQQKVTLRSQEIEINKEDT
ncbi:YsnF/AvaK domain-containing protein [Pantoea sp. FN0305]|uniref:YsnF/AvaK domain-containing protein n=1 Tax=Pantoea sp. FN0305 TaxID=3418559 RepID=UPI003CF375F2